MSKPASGDYYIVNSVLSPTGDRLAITYNNQGNPVTVTPLTSPVSDSQKWTLVDSSNKEFQSILPFGFKGILQAAPIQVSKSNVIGVIQVPAGGSPVVYRIRGGGGQPYTIQDNVPSSSNNWAVAIAKSNNRVNWGSNAGQSNKWILQPVV